MARFSGATLLLILVATVSVYTCAILAGAALGRALGSPTRTMTKQPLARDTALRVSVSFRVLAEDFAKELWGGNRMEGRPGGGARAGAGDSAAAAAALSSSAARASHPISQAELDYRQRQVMLGQRAATPGEISSSDDVPSATTARPFSRRSNFSGEITEGTQPGGGVVKVGPWGGPGGQAFYFRRGGNGGRGGARSAPRLLSVSVYHTDAVHGFAFEYLLAGVRRTTGPPDGHYYAPEGFGPVITTESKMELSWDEHLTAVEGTFGHCASLPAQVVVTSLTFRTDKGATYGPYGEETGTPFSVPAVNGCIVGFWVRSHFILDAIGVYIMPCQLPS